MFSNNGSFPSWLSGKNKNAARKPQSECLVQNYTNSHYVFKRCFFLIFSIPVFVFRFSTVFVFCFAPFLVGNNYCKNVQFDRLFLWYFSIYLCINFLPHCMYVFPFFSMAISSITKACRFLFISLPCSRANNPMLSTPYVLFSFLLRAEKSSNTLELL